MKETNTSRKELADMLLVSPSTLDGWLLLKNPRPIPAKKQGALETIMAPKKEGDIELKLNISPERWRCLTADITDGIDKKEAIKRQLYAFIDAAGSPFRN